MRAKTRVVRLARAVLPRPIRQLVSDTRKRIRGAPAIVDGYQQRDYEVVDYKLVPLPSTSMAVRGPLPANLAKNGYFVCMGAAQTFGCFTDRPYPALLAERLGRDVLNLAWGGVGPRFFLDRPRLIEYANGATLAIVQVMSGRSEDNALFESRGGSSGVRRSDGKTMLARDFYAELLASGDEELARRTVAETRANWIESYVTLLELIKVPTILLWFSRREPAYREAYTDVISLYGEFPQLVNTEMVEKVRKHATCDVECVTRRGSPELLVSRFTGHPTTIARPGRTWTHNNNYPSPEMHVDAAAALEPVCLQYL